MKKHCKIIFGTIVTIGAIVLAPGNAFASSHREGPFVTENPKVDGTDFYLFRSYESGRSDYVTIIANYVPLQDSYGGPNYFSMDPEAAYDINLDTDGDAKSNLTFRFQFDNNLRDTALTIGTGANAKSVPIPLIHGIGQTSATDISKINVLESYTVKLLRTVRGRITTRNVTNQATGSRVFEKPLDNIGTKTIANYAAYAAAHVFNVTIPGCSLPGKMFVGQRKEPFVVNLGETFDQVNYNPLGASNSQSNSVADKNITSLMLEVATSCLVPGSDPVIGGWTTASLPKIRVLKSDRRGIGRGPSFNSPASEAGDFVQVSRLGNPLVNEVVIGLSSKDEFNASQPKDDAQFGSFVTHPTLPAILEALFGVTAPTAIPRADLVQIFLTGVPSLNKPLSSKAVASEMMRLNTSITAVAAASQNPLGVIGGDNAGYPNGRRPGDDVVDISLRAVMGKLLPISDAPSGQLAYTDGAVIDASMFDQAFPYFKTPLPGSPES